MQKPFFSTVEYFPPSSCKVCFSSFAVALTSPPNPFFFQRRGKVPLGFRSVADVATVLFFLFVPLSKRGEKIQAFFSVFPSQRCSCPLPSSSSSCLVSSLGQSLRRIGMGSLLYLLLFFPLFALAYCKGKKIGAPPPAPP